jgi:hypothetical protein
MAAPETTSAEDGDANFSRLEASFGQTEVAPRDNSVDLRNIYRHAKPGDIDVDELDFDFSLDRSHYPLDDLLSLQDVFSAVLHESYLSNPINFAPETQITCFEADGGATSRCKSLCIDLAYIYLTASRMASPGLPAPFQPSSGLFDSMWV